MRGGMLKFAASEVINGSCTSDVAISKGLIETHVSFYEYSNAWMTFGEALQTFPLQSQDVVTFKAGAPEPNTNNQRRASILLKAYCYDHQGHTAIQIIVDNNEPLPVKERLELSIVAEAASLNSLGKLLANWRVETESEIVWKAQIS